MQVSGQLDPRMIKLAFVFVLVGYGTKAGLAPMHTWLPDAHSEAPSPTSAMLSGVSLKVALYALLRFHILTTACLGSSFSRTFLLVFGLGSMCLAAPFILVQTNLKRLLAYSSLEHVGLICVGFGLNSPVTIWGAKDDDMLKQDRDAGVVRVIISLESAKSDAILPELDRWARAAQKVA